MLTKNQLKLVNSIEEAISRIETTLVRIDGESTLYNRQGQAIYLPTEAIDTLKQYLLKERAELRLQAYNLGVDLTK